ncbi:MAG: winged helix-turn-helix transcriptional regulator [Saprospiraceae bacterium]|nr:winged helix-turn-helix transcriptional regulator [Saprospiraceae bacterium]
MAINKSLEFSKELVELAEFAKALSHPARIAILQTLAEKQMCICGEIVEVLPLAQATVSQHLKELKNAGLIKGEIEGKKSCYCIDWEAFDRFTDKMNSMFKDLSNQQCC